MFRRFLWICIVLGVGIFLFMGIVAFTNTRLVSAWTLAPSVPPILIDKYPIIQPVPLTTTISLTYDQPISLTTVHSQTFVIYSMQTGIVTRTYEVDGNQVLADSIAPFKPGELIQVSATTNILNLANEKPISPTVWIFRTAVIPGSGIFQKYNQNMPASDARDVEMGDIDKDGDLDLCIGTTSQIQIWLNDNNSFFTQSETVGRATSNLSDFALSDLNADGNLDILLVRYSSPGGFEVWLNDGAGHFTDINQIASENVSYSRTVKTGDLDGDGDLDAIVGRGSILATYYSRVWFNDGQGVFTDTQQFIEISNTKEIALGDLDGDDDLDIFMANGTGPASLGNSVWKNNGSGYFSFFGSRIGNENTWSVSLGDVDNDGDLDALTGNDNNVDNKLWLNNGNATFVDSGQSLGLPINTGKHAVLLGDTDGDNDLDAFIAKGNDSGHNSLWLNENGIFSETAQQLGTLWSLVATMGDLDEDGDLDLVLANAENEMAEIWIQGEIQTPMPTLTPTNTPTSTSTSTTTNTPTATPTGTSTNTPTATPTGTSTATPTYMATDTPSPTATATPDICRVNFDAPAIAGTNFVDISGEIGELVRIVNLTTGGQLISSNYKLEGPFDGHACPGFVTVLLNETLVAGHWIAVESSDGTVDITFVLPGTPTSTPTATPTSTPTATNDYWQYFPIIMNKMSMGTSKYKLSGSR